MAKNYAVKLPDGMHEAFDDKCKSLGKTPYTVLQELMLVWLQVQPKPKMPEVPKKAMPVVPPKVVASAPRTFWDVARRVNKLILEDVDQADEVPRALWAEFQRCTIPPQLDSASARDLEKIRDRWRGEYPRLYVLDTYEKGCLEAAEEDWRASLPKLTPRASLLDKA
jgi:hypothetical protein